MAFKVTAKEKNTNKLVAEYIFDTLTEATKFHAAMMGKGYLTVLARIKV
jgi:hypothetical protein